jgi:hypothetical protein
MPALDLTARGQGYYVVYVNDAKFSQHTQEREAIERVTELLQADMALRVHYVHEYVVDATLDLDAHEAPPVTDPAVLPVSDGGMDLVDFLSMLDEQSNGPIIVGEVIQAPDFWSGMVHLVSQHRDSGSWLFHRIVGQDADGNKTRIGLTWKGYLLLWHLRDKAAIRINTGQAE